MSSEDMNLEDRASALSWPVVDGAYVVGDPSAPVAVCTLTSHELLKPLAALPGVAIAGEVQTANAGIERIIINVTANPAIRFLLLCGKESRLFRPGQSLSALLENGVDAERRIIGAYGYEPILRNLPPQQIEAFRRQVELVDWAGEQDIDALEERIQGLTARNPGRLAQPWLSANAAVASAKEQAAQFQPIRPGGQREPLIYDPKGYFVISLDRAAGQIVLRHYLPDHTPAHEMRGRTGESMLLGLLREGLVSQLSHAGYLGAELAKAESALRLGTGIRYIQDRPLQQDVTQPGDEKNAAPASSSVTLTWEQFIGKAGNEKVDIAMVVTAQPAMHLLEGDFLAPELGSDDPLRSFRRTDHPVRARWSNETRVVMGSSTHFEPGAILRVHGMLRIPAEIDAELIAILTHMAKISEKR